MLDYVKLLLQSSYISIYNNFYLKLSLIFTENARGFKALHFSARILGNPVHAWLRDQGVWSVAPVRKGCKRGQYRRQLRDCFDWCLYWLRNLVESLISAVKRLYGSTMRARTARMQRAEISAKLIAYNLGAIKTTTFY